MSLDSSSKDQKGSDTTDGKQAHSSVLPDKKLLLRTISSSQESEGEFYFPFDDGSVSSPGKVTDSEECKQKEQQKHHQAAICSLEAFFQCRPREDSKTIIKTSPISVLDIPLRPNIETSSYPLFIPSVSPEQTVDEAHVTATPNSHEEKPYVSPAATRLSLDSQEDAYSPDLFVKLQPSDRAQSMPLEYSSTSRLVLEGKLPSISKKPSLKKISSIGKGLAKNCKSEGNLVQRTVSFSSLSIREYPPALSDNPSCSYGPPVQLDWDHEAEQTHHIDHYEQSRMPRRESHELLLSYYDRRYLLLKKAGYSKREVRETMKEVERVKRERMMTDLFLPAQALDETMENVVASVRQFFRGQDKTPQDTTETER